MRTILDIPQTTPRGGVLRRAEFMYNNNNNGIVSGLHDYSPYLALHTVIDFWNTVGCDKIRGYMYQLTRQAGEHNAAQVS